jgi:hypothetical protein
MRKGMDGLAMLAQQVLNENPAGRRDSPTDGA